MIYGGKFAALVSPRLPLNNQGRIRAVKVMPVKMMPVNIMEVSMVDMRGLTLFLMGGGTDEPE